MAKHKLDLYYVMTNLYTIFQVNISKDSRERFRKLNFSKGWQIYVPNYKSISQKMAEKILENWILAKVSYSCKGGSSVAKLKLDLYYVMTNLYTIFQVNISKDSRERFRKLNFSKGWQIYVPNYKSISQKMAEKSLENWILAKVSYSCKGGSSVAKLKLDLYYVMTNLYTKFQVNI